MLLALLMMLTMLPAAALADEPDGEAPPATVTEEGADLPDEGADEEAAPDSSDNSAELPETDDKTAEPADTVPADAVPEEGTDEDPAPDDSGIMLFIEDENADPADAPTDAEPGEGADPADAPADAEPGDAADSADAPADAEPGNAADPAGIPAVVGEPAPMPEKGTDEDAAPDAGDESGIALADGGTTELKEITEINIIGVTLPPKAGEKMDYDVTVPPDANYSLKSGDGIEWTYSAGDGSVWTAITDYFMAGKTYQMHAKVTPNEGYKFANSVTFKINGDTSLVTKKGFSSDRSYAFLWTKDYPVEGTQPTKITEIDAAIDFPETGKTPDFNADLPVGANYHIANEEEAKRITKFSYLRPINGIVWYDEKHDQMTETSSFESGKDYRFRVYLVPNAGYEFADEVTFKINGDSSLTDTTTNSYRCFTSRGVIGCLVSKELSTPKSITSVAVTNVPTPVAGQSCSTDSITITTDPANAADVKDFYWCDETTHDALSSSDAFTAGHEYTLCVELEPEDGYAFEFNTSGNYTGTATFNSEAADRVEELLGSDNGLFIASKIVTATAGGGTTPPAVEYQFTAGGGGVYTKGSGLTLEFTANGPKNDCTAIQVDGAEIDAENYTLVSGSTIITLTSDYLETLDVGEHTLAAVYGRTEAKTGFSVKLADAPTDPTTFPVTISKTDPNGSKIAGATLEIEVLDGDFVMEWTSGAGQSQDVNLQPGTYTLTEAREPEGYKIADPIEFTVNPDGTITVGRETVTQIVMVDQFCDQTVTFSKTDPDGKEIAGATLEITDSDGNTVEEWTSVEGQSFEMDLQPGTYTLTETRNPEGYKIADPIEFTVNPDGTIAVGRDIVDVVVMVDELDDTPDPGATDRDDTPDPGATDRDDTPDPGTTDKDDTPDPGTTDRDDTPDPGTTDRDDTPDPGTTDKDDTPDPGTTDRDDTPSTNDKNNKTPSGSSGNNSNSGRGTSPKTEDSVNPILWIALLAVSCIGIAITCIARKKNRQSK